MSLYKLHFCKILPLPEILPPLEIGYGTPMYASFITNVNRRSNNVNQHAINALESMKDKDEYSNYGVNKTTNERFQCSLHLYTKLNCYDSVVDSELINRQLPDLSNLPFSQKSLPPS